MTGKKIETRNPADGSVLASYAVHTTEQISEILGRAAQTQKTWKQSTPKERSELMARLSEALLAAKNDLATLMQEEMGKTQAEAVAEIEKCASCARFYAEKGAAFLAPIDIKTEASHSFVSFEPLGVVFAVMPWNFPFWQVFRCAIPAITAGNTVVLKHASNVTGCALAAEKLFRQISDQALFQAVIAPGEAALTLIERPEVAAVSFTGSTAVGKKIAATAASVLKKCVLELGGSDAYVVLADADVDKAAEVCAKSRLINAGQSCISAKRFIVEASVKDAFEKKFVAALAQAKIAPLAREDLRDDLHDQVKRTLAAGAKAVLGGQKPKGPGAHYPATVLSGVKPGMPAFEEELFGPVAALIEARDEKHALELANQSIYGLGAAVFTRDKARGEKIAKEKLEAGSCFVNELVRSDPRLPFGGVKESGYGRELADFGIREFTNIKTVYVG
jgi:succinate-semialdehyde dehydrogenase/glutarate-semialdehyde dehydrogenase